MEFVPIPSTVKVELLFSWDGQRCENVFHVRTPNTINELELDEIQGLFYLWYSTYLYGKQSNAVSSLGMVLSDASDQFGVKKEYAPGIVYQGGHSATPSLPNNVTVSMKWNTGLRGRSYRGRTYHIGLCESMVTGNNLAGAEPAAFIGVYAQLISTLDGAGKELVVASKFQGNAPRVTGVATTILTCTTDGVIDSQRRRLPGRGR